MTTDKKLDLLIVDDAEDSRSLLEMMLSDRFVLHSADSGAACMAILQTTKPALILLDIHMPDLSGFDVLRLIKAIPDLVKVPIIFVSGTESITERLKAYEEGAADYVSKPFSIDNLNAKVDAAIAVQLELQAMEARSMMAMSTAMEAMTASGEMGILMSFVRVSSGLKDATELGNEILKCLSEFGLSACVFIKRDVGYTLLGCDADSMEGKVLISVDKDKDVMEFGKRVLICRDNVRLLIKNMPTDNESKYGRVKDNLNVLCDCANAQANNLRMMYSMQRNRDRLLEEIIKKSETQLDSVRVKLSQHADETNKIMTGMVLALDERLMFLGLDDDQEKSLRHLADQTHENIEALSAINNEIYASVDSVMQGLYHLVQNDT